MYLPLLSKKEQLQELVTFPPLDTRRSFYMPLSAPRGLLSQLLQVPFFRIPKTLGWPFLDSPMPPFSTSSNLPTASPGPIGCPTFPAPPTHPQPPSNGM